MVGILYKVSLYSATALTYSTVGNTPIVQIPFGTRKLVFQGGRAVKRQSQDLNLGQTGSGEGNGNPL